MFIKKSKLEKFMQNIDELNNIFTKNNILDLLELLGNKKQLLIRNFLSGIAKGIGIGIGFSLLTAVLVIILQKIVTLNIQDIMDIVEGSKR